MEQQDNRLALEKKVFVGIDVHKESWHVTIRTDGEEVFNGRIPGSYASLKKVLDRYRGNRMKVAYEAGSFGFWLHDRLMEDGVETLVVPPPSLLNREIRSKQIRGTAENSPYSLNGTC